MIATALIREKSLLALSILLSLSRAEVENNHHVRCYGDLEKPGQSQLQPASASQLASWLFTTSYPVFRVLSFLMSQEDYPIEFVLDSLDSIMPPSKQPKVL